MPFPKKKSIEINEMKIEMKWNENKWKLKNVKKKELLICSKTRKERAVCETIDKGMN